MELKSYQKTALADFSRYLTWYRRSGSGAQAFRDFWNEKGVRVGGADGIPGYRDALDGVPAVCFKVPTGGGKTFIAASSVRTVFDALSASPQVVVWFVPSDAILTQTLAALRNPSHPYRMALDRDFGGRVAVLSKAEALEGRDFSPVQVADQLTVLVFSYDSFRRGNKEGLKAYQQNGNLAAFPEVFGHAVAVPDADPTSLISVVANLHPFAVVDESHHAGSTLSVEMLKSVHPRCVTELTATPRAASNVIASVGALALKREHMVKLPVIVYNRQDKQQVIADAIDLRRSLEELALAEHEAGGAYIRPIALMQAEPRATDDVTTFEKISDVLVAAGVPQEQIAIKTATVDDLRGVDLLSPACPVRFVITVNALKEGWDCPFAYVLASIQNKTSKTDVEQVVGRVLRQPGARRCRVGALNRSYVLTSSADFHATLSSVVEGLNRAGFSRADYRVGGQEELAGVAAGGAGAAGAAGAGETPSVPAPAPTPMPVQDDLFEGLSGERIAEDLAERQRDGAGAAAAGAGASDASAGTMSQGAAALLAQAQRIGDAYDQAAADAGSGESLAAQFNVPIEMVDKMNEFAPYPEFADDVAQLRVPQFCVKDEQSLFGLFDDDAGDAAGDEYRLLTTEELLDGFSLVKLGIETISFSSALDESARAVDVMHDNDSAKAIALSGRDAQSLIQLMGDKPEETHRRQCVLYICEMVERNARFSNAYRSRDVRAYVQRVVDAMGSDELEAYQRKQYSFARIVWRAIDEAAQGYALARFKERLAVGSIVCRPQWQLPARNVVASAETGIAGSLYQGEEGGMNDFERDMALALGSCRGVRWWHRLRERKQGEFVLNGAVLNHYPDFMVRLENEQLWLIETKGNDRNNEDSRRKRELGAQWAARAGEGFRYFMVFESVDVPDDNAFTFERFKKLLGGLA